MGSSLSPCALGSGREGAEPAGWGDLCVPGGLSSRNPQTQPAANSAPAPWNCELGEDIFQGYTDLLVCVCVFYLFFKKLIFWPSECGATCLCVTKNSCKHSAKAAASRNVAVCLYFSDGIAI